jgi:serine/threonine protein kinase
MFATEKATGKIVAVKEVGMEQISKAGLEEHIFREKNIMKELKGHPFMIDLIETTKDEKNLYFISEICTGGNLFELVDFRNKLSLQVTKAYAAQIASILAHL